MSIQKSKGFTLVEVLISFLILMVCVGILSKLTNQWIGVLERQEYLLAGSVCLDKQILRLQTFGAALSAKKEDEYTCYQYGKRLQVTTIIRESGVSGLKVAQVSIKSDSGKQIIGVQKLIYGY